MELEGTLQHSKQSDLNLSQMKPVLAVPYYS